MKEVEEYIDNEISVQELITFLVDEVYPNYTPFMNLFGNNPDRMKEILRANIGSIRRIPKEKKDGVAARYNITNKEIHFYSKNKLSIDDIRKNNDMMHIFVHESLHAILINARQKDLIITGCSANGKKNKKVIRGVFNDFFRLESKKGFLRRFLMKENFYRRIGDTYLGDGLNEGFTVWLTEKILGTEMSREAYRLEKYYVETIAELIGEEKTLKIADGDFHEIGKMLNMKDGDIVFFLKSLDIASSELAAIDASGDINNPGYETNRSMGLFDTFHGAAQFGFINGFIIPEYQKKIEKDGLDFKNLEKLCYIVSRFKGINEIAKFGKSDFVPKGQETYMMLEDYLEEKFIEFSNNTDISTLSDTEVMDINSIYDYIFMRLRKKKYR